MNISTFRKCWVWKNKQFAGPPAHGVSEPEQPIPSPWSLVQSCSSCSPAVLLDTMKWCPGEALELPVSPNLPPSNSVILFLSHPKINHEIYDDFERFLEPKWSPKSTKIHRKIDLKMDVVFDTVFGSIWNVFGTSNLENRAVAWEGC